MAALSRRFTRFANFECGASPLYRALALAVARDRELLAIAATARHGPIPNLFLAAVHDLLLRGMGGHLAACYTTVAGFNALPSDAAPARFRAFVLASRDEIAPALEQRLVQTNEVRRAGMLYLALCWLRERFGLHAAALVEAGTSAGLLLATDQYGYRFGDTTVLESSHTELIVETELRGSRPVLDVALPEIVERIGIDLATLDLSDESDRRWLRALIWGDQPERLARLDAAIEVARNIPMQLIEGDANEVLPDVLGGLKPGLPAVVFHSHALNQFPVEAREQFDHELCQASRQRDIHRIAMEGRVPHPVCAASFYRAGQLVCSTDLARYDAHGAWIEWTG